VEAVLKSRLAILIAGCVLLWFGMVAGVLCYRALQTGALDLAADENRVLILHTAVAALLCLVPTAATLLWCELVLGGSPEQQLAAVMGGTAIRMVFVVAAAMVLYFNFEDFHSGGFWIWVVVFYLATLVLETTLVARRQAMLDKRP
jgi:hypothetical protein